MNVINAAYTAGELFSKAKNYFKESGDSMMNMGSRLLTSLGETFEDLCDKMSDYERIYSISNLSTAELHQNFIRVKPSVAQGIYDIFKHYPTFTDVNNRTFCVKSAPSFSQPIPIPSGHGALLYQFKTSGFPITQPVDECILIRDFDDDLGTYVYYLSPTIRCLGPDGLRGFPITKDWEWNHTDTSVIEAVAKAINQYQANNFAAMMVSINSYYSLGLPAPASMSYYKFTTELLFQQGVGATNREKAFSILRTAVYDNIAIRMRDVVKQIIASATFNLNMSEAIGFCSNDDTQGLITFLNSAKVQSEINDLNVSNLYSSITDAVNTGGIASASAIIAKLLKSATTVADDGDGTFSFTDNDALVPQIFGVGIIQSVISVVGVVATTIAAIYNQVAAIIVNAVFNLITQIVSFVNTNYDKETLAGIDAKGTIMCYPSIIYHGTTPLSEIEEAEPIISQRLLDYGAVYQTIPGAVILWWLSSDTEVSYEVHVTPVEKSIAQQILYKAQYDGLLTSYLVNSDTHYYLSSSSSKLDIYADAVDAFYSLNLDAVVKIVQNADMVSRDAQLRAAYTGGFAIAMIYLLLSPWFHSTTVIKPWKSDGTRNVASDKFAQALDALLYLIHDPYSLNSDSIFGATWREILAAQDNYGHIFSLLEGFNEELDYLNYYTSTGGNISFNDSFVLRMFGLLDYFYDAESDYNSALPQAISTTLRSTITMPKYDRNTFWASAIGAALVIATVTAVAVITVRLARKAISNWNAKWRAKAEASWQSYLDNPTSANYNQYYKSVKANNILTKITGGTKLSKASYWDDVSTSDRDPATNTRAIATVTDSTNDKIDQINRNITGEALS